MSDIFLKNLLSGGKTSILNELYNARADKLATDKLKVPNGNTENFLDIVDNVGNEELKKQLIYKYLESEDVLSSECARLMKKYYFHGCSDILNLVLECGKNRL